MACNILPVFPQQLGHKFDRAVKRSSPPRIIIWTNLADFESPSLGMADILFNGAEPFEQIVNTPLKQGPMWNLVKLGAAVSEKTKF